MQSGVVVLICSSSILGVETKGSVIEGQCQLHSKFYISMKYKHKTLLKNNEMIHYVDASFLPLIFLLCLFFWFWPLEKIPAPVTRYDDEEMTYLEDSSILCGDSKFFLLGPAKYIDIHLDVVPLILQPVVYIAYPSSCCLVKVCIQGPETTFSYSFFPEW